MNKNTAVKNFFFCLQSALLRIFFKYKQCNPDMYSIGQMVCKMPRISMTNKTKCQGTR